MQPSGHSGGRDLAILAREIIDANQYQTLATADGDGRLWAAPVWYAHQGLQKSRGGSAGVDR